MTAAGITVHWARDGADANRIVSDIAKAKGVDEVVKIKSMVTQEIDLNEHLEAEGIAAWETDLAELIVQLGHDLPSHILVPAIHRNRSEVREIFTEEMGRYGVAAPEGISDDPTELTNAARAHLREKFLRAKMGVSGGNFIVAETGTLVIVESEGNGRMCLTLPETFVSIVGIEKILPTLEDLEVFLKLLPRSSTGERMNPYTSFWTGVTPGDGPQDLHVILLDNGRTNAAGRPRGTGSAALHPLLGLPQHLPRLRTGRRPRLRLALPGPDRRHPRTRSCAAWRRPTTGRCRSRPRCAAPATTCAPSGSRSPTSSCTCVTRRSSTRPAKHPTGEQAIMKGAGWVMSDG